MDLSNFYKPKKLPYVLKQKEITMFFDFNIGYPKNQCCIEVDSSKKETASAGKRARMALVHLSNVPIKFIKAISELAQLILAALFAGVCFGQSTKMNDNVVFAAKKYIITSFDCDISLVGFFAPINAEKWKRDVRDMLFRPDVKKLFERLNNDTSLSHGERQQGYSSAFLANW